MSAAVMTDYLFAPVRRHERRSGYRSMRVLMVVSAFCAGMMAGTTMTFIL